MSSFVLSIVVGIIWNQESNQLYICQRKAKQHKAGYWEFPGGKVEENETLIQALARELQEEVGIELKEASPFFHCVHDYGDRIVELNFMSVNSFNHTPYGKEGQLGRWVGVSDLMSYRFPEANQAVIERLLKEYAE